MRAFLVSLCLLLAACKSETQQEVSDKPAVFTVDAVPLTIEYALDSDEHAKGLMHRKALAAEAGMLFVFPAPRQMSFWMKNTYVKLDIGYFDKQGVLQEIHRLHPHSLDSVKSTNDQMQFALEVNRGWFRKHGLKPGAKIDLEVVRAAIRERGKKPSDWGL